MADNNLSEFSVVPQAISDELIFIGQQMSDNFWRVGDLVNQAYELILANNKDVPKMALFGWAARRVGMSASWVRKNSYLAAFFPEEVRKKYEPLPAAHFEFAMRFRNKEPDGTYVWQTILDRSIEYFEDRGFAPNVDALERAFQERLEAEKEDLQHGELPPPPVSAAITGEEDHPEEDGEENDPEIPWEPIIEGLADPENENEDMTRESHEESISVLTSQLIEITGRVAEMIPPLLNLLDIMGRFPELDWAKYFRVEAATVGVRMRQIKAMAGKMGGHIDAVFVSEDDRAYDTEQVEETVVDYSEPLSPTDEMEPDEENTDQPHTNMGSFTEYRPNNENVERDSVT